MNDNDADDDDDDDDDDEPDFDEEEEEESDFPDDLGSARLRIWSNDSSELFLIDGNLHLAANGVGRLNATVPPGAYKIRAICAGVQRESLIIAEPGWERDIDFYVQGIETVGPSAHVLGDGVEAFGRAVAALNRAAILCKPARMAVYFFASATPETGGSLFRGMRVFPWRQAGEAVTLSSRNSQCVAAGSRRWEIARIDLCPGLHLLDLPTGARRVRLVLPVRDGAETHVSLRRWEVRSLAGEVESKPEIAIQLRREEYLLLSSAGGTDDAVLAAFRCFVDMSGDLELEQSARVALADNRVLTLWDDHIYRLLHLKFNDPVIGMIAAHLMFDTFELYADRKRRDRALGTLEGFAFSDGLVDTVLRKLSGLLGEDGTKSALPPADPDLAALFLRAGRPWREPFALTVPPLLWRSWATLTDPANAKSVVVQPRLWSDTKFHQAYGVYFSWEPHRMSVERFLDHFAPNTVESEEVAARISGIEGRLALGTDETAAEVLFGTPASVSDKLRKLPEAAASQSLGQFGMRDIGISGREARRQTARHLGVPENVFDKLF